MFDACLVSPIHNELSQSHDACMTAKENSTSERTLVYDSCWM